MGASRGPDLGRDTYSMSLLRKIELETEEMDETTEGL